MFAIFYGQSQTINFVVDYYPGSLHFGPWILKDQGNDWEVMQDSAGSYYTAGFISSSCTSFRCPYLCKIDSAGNLLWSKTYNGSAFGLNANAARGVTIDKDGFLIVTGCINCGDYPPNDNQNLLMKLDANTGDTIWVRTYGGPQREWANSVCIAADGGYVMAGRTNSWGQGSADMWFVKTDTAGNMLWDTTFDVQGEAWANSIALTNDGGFIACGTMCAGICQIPTLVKLDSIGNIQWWQQYPGQGTYTVAYSVNKTYDKGYIISGTDFEDAFVIKTDSMGNSKWQKWFTNIPDTLHERGYSIISTLDSCYLLIKWGYIDAQPPSWSPYQLFHDFIKLDSAGNTIWEKNFFQDSLGWNPFDTAWNYYWGPHDIKQAHDGGFIIATEKGVFIKTDADMNFLNADFHAITGNCDSVTSYTYFCAGLTSPGTNIVWDFGDGGTSTLYNPIHIYSANGTYTVTMIASNVLGSDTVSKIVDVVNYAFATGSINAPANIVAVNTPATIIGNTQNASFNEWDFGDGTTDYTDYWDSVTYCVANFSDTIYHIYTDTGTYTVMLIYYGCCSSDTAYIIITVLDSLTSAAENMEIEAGAFVYPNPAGDNIHIKSSAGFNDAEFKLSDATGRIILHWKIKSKETISVSSLQSGIYLYEINDRNGITVRGKMIKE